MKLLQKTTLFILLALTTVFFFGCEREPSDSVDQDKIYTEYELFYNANEDKSYARTTFKSSNALGTKLELSDGAEISFNGDVLPWKAGLAYYEQDYAGFVDAGTFTYVDLDGVTYQNDISLKTIAYPAGLDTLSRDAAFGLTWVGEALDIGDDVTVTINGVEEGDAQIFYTNAPGATDIVLGKNKLEQLGDGEGTIWMDRRAYPGLAVETAAGGFIVGRYRPVNATPYLN